MYYCYYPSSNGIRYLPTPCNGASSSPLPLEVAERVFGMSPSSLISIASTEATAEPLLLVNTKEDPEHLTRSAMVIPARLVPSHAAGQSIDNDAGCEDSWQVAGCCWVASVSDAAFLHQRYVWRVVGSRQGGSSCGS